MWRGMDLDLLSTKYFFCVENIALEIEEGEGKGVLDP